MAQAVNIVGIGTGFPERTMRNSDFAWREAGVTEERAMRSGVLERRWAAPKETIVDLASEACERALACAELRPDQIDRLLFVTSTLRPNVLVPTGAVELQDALGMDNCVATTLLETCCGALIALDYAAGLIRAGMARRVMIVCSETFSKTFNPTMPITYEIGMIVGDGAAAVVLSGCEPWGDGLVGSVLHSNADFQSGLGMRPLRMERNGVEEVALKFGSVGTPPTFRGMPVAGGELLEALKWFTSTTVPAAVREVLARCELCTSDIQFFLLHQPSRLFLDSWKRECGIPEERTLDTLARYGNISSAAVLVNLAEAWRQGRLKPDDLVLLAAAGEGACWGAMIWKWRLPKKG